MARFVCWFGKRAAAVWSCLGRWGWLEWRNPKWWFMGFLFVFVDGSMDLLIFLSRVKISYLFLLLLLPCFAFRAVMSHEVQGRWLIKSFQWAPTAASWMHKYSKHNFATVTCSKLQDRMVKGVANSLWCTPFPKAAMLNPPGSEEDGNWEKDRLKNTWVWE